jgi:putative ABC transport system permease protein
MMTASHTSNRSMFWRIVRRLLTANLSRLFVILLALGAGAAVTAALLNLQIDAKRRLTNEFRSFGPNVIIAPRNSNDSTATLRPATISESLLDQLPLQEGNRPVPAAALLYTTANVTAYSDEGIHNTQLGSGLVVLTGFRVNSETRIFPYHVLNPNHGVILDAETCDVGERVASQFRLQFGGVLQWKVAGKEGECIVSELDSFGGAEDSQVFLPMESVQKLTDMPHQVSLLQLIVSGTPKQIEKYVASLQKQFPDVDVRPIRQFTEGEASIYNRISGLLTATVAIVLLLTGLCVMAAMTNIAIERKNDVGLMKAVGGSMRRVLRLFLVEAAVLGLAGGIVGAAAGILISIALGKAVFGVAAQPRLIVYPVAVALTVVVAILGAYPLRRLANIRPASVFRGEA